MGGKGQEVFFKQYFDQLMLHPFAGQNLQQLWSPNNRNLTRINQIWGDSAIFTDLWWLSNILLFSVIRPAESRYRERRNRTMQSEVSSCVTSCVTTSLMTSCESTKIVSKQLSSGSPVKLENLVINFLVYNFQLTFEYNNFWNGSPGCQSSPEDF